VAGRITAVPSVAVVDEEPVVDEPVVPATREPVDETETMETR